VKQTELKAMIETPSTETKHKIENNYRTKIQNKNTEQKSRKSLLLKTSIRVKCPRLGKEVNPKKECLNCQYFHHVTYIGVFGVLIACSYGVKKHEP